MTTGQLFINGKWCTGQGDAFSSVNPADNQTIWQGNSADENQVKQAVAAARAAFTSWSQIDISERIEYINRFAELLDENKQQLATIISQEMGKPLWETLTEVTAMKGKIPISIQANNERTGVKITENGSTVQSLRHRPHGVLAVFGPYNFPGHLPNGHIVPALLAGNTVIFKPSELTPATAEYTLKLWQQSGLPDGVLNLLQGEVATGKALASNNDIDGLLFTGSANTGKLLHQQFSGQPQKILALEMGGNNPLIVKSIDSMQSVIYTLLQSAFISTGQRCTCARRLFVPKGEQGDRLIQTLVTATQNIKIGQYDAEPAPFMGPVVSRAAAKSLRAAYLKLLDLGSKPLTELKHLDENTGFVTPGIVDVTDITYPDEEYFGPLLKVIRYDDFDSAITQANQTRFGLAAGLLGGSQTDYEHFLSRIRAGIVNWNTQTTGASSNAPFGGVGISGNHRASAYYAADYCAYPVASLESSSIKMPETLSPGITI